MVIHCTECPEAATSLVRCSVASAASTSPSGHHAEDSANGDHHQGHAAGGHHGHAKAVAETDAPGAHHDGHGGSHPGQHEHQSSGDCCESGQLRLAKSIDSGIEAPAPIVNVSILPLETETLRPASFRGLRLFDHPAHSPPLYLLLLTLLN
jgi:hypothetical protein